MKQIKVTGIVIGCLELKILKSGKKSLLNFEYSPLNLKSLLNVLLLLVCTENTPEIRNKKFKIIDAKKNERKALLSPYKT